MPSKGQGIAGTTSSEYAAVLAAAAFLDEEPIDALQCIPVNSHPQHEAAVSGSSLLSGRSERDAAVGVLWLPPLMQNLSGEAP